MKNHWLLKAKQRKNSYWFGMIRINVLGNYDNILTSCKTLNELFEEIEAAADYAHMHGGYISFADAQGVLPTDRWETVISIRCNGDYLIPISAGGSWSEWDEYQASLKP